MKTLPKAHAPIPSSVDTATALENLVNSSLWIHIDNDAEEGKQRVVVFLEDGRVMTERAPFIAQALVALWPRVNQ